MSDTQACLEPKQPRRRWKWSRRRVRRATLAHNPTAVGLSTTVDIAPTAGSTELERAFLKLCAEWGVPVFHDQDSRRNPSGLPDVVAVVDDTLLLVEFKADRRYPDPAQRRWLEALARVRYVATGVVRPADWQDFIAAVRAMRATDGDIRS